MNIARLITGEIIGTFMMCFLGIGAVATATLYGSLTGPGQVGLVWGIAIALGIYMTRNLSDAHFNPAVTLAMCIAGRTKWRELPIYLAGQCIGAFLAAGALWILFAESVAKNLALSGLTMSTNSIGTAATIWAEVYPNTSSALLSLQGAMFAEGFGVFVLVSVIFLMTDHFNTGRPSRLIAPLFIGLTVSVLICVIGPLTNAGLNPARDLMPRVLAMMVGWKTVAFGTNAFNVWMVYTVGPLAGAALAALLYRFVLAPMHKAAAESKPGQLELVNRASRVETPQLSTQITE
ncbi:MAG: MIP/aquaporin family protein [Coriobacteriales bacterium]